MRKPSLSDDPEARSRVKLEIVRHLQAGATMRAVTALPGGEAIKRWRRDNPTFDAELAYAWRPGARTGLHFRLLRSTRQRSSHL